MLSQETSDDFISVFVMLMIVLLGEALLRCVAKTHSGYGGIKVQDGGEGGVHTNLKFLHESKNDSYK